MEREQFLHHQNKYSDTANFDKDQYTNFSQHSFYWPHLKLHEFPLSRNYIFWETIFFKSSKSIHSVVTTELSIRQIVSDAIFSHGKDVGKFGVRCPL